MMIIPSGLWSWRIPILILLTVMKGSRSQPDGFLAENVCLNRNNIYRNETHKEEYRIGVLAIRGVEAAYKEFNKTFSEYLTVTAGSRFDRPIKFTMVPLNFISLFGDVELATSTGGEQGVDFIYVNPSAFSCIESEYGANTLVSQISRRVVGGQEYHLTKFGGVIFARSDNDEVNTIEDLRDKTIACASISGLGSGQMQFRLLQQRGLSYIQDPKQLVFTSNQGKVVNGVLKGSFDVGFVRTDQLERTKDARTGELVNTSEVKVINGFFPTLEGEPFPFESSTILYPEWNVASLSHVANDVALEVQKAMLAIQEHAAVGANLDQCYHAKNCSNADNMFGSNSGCMASCVDEVNPDLMSRCDTTPALATLALTAKKSGKYAGWRSTLSYMELRNMQEETNFIRKQSNGINACIRSARIVDAVVCPPGHIRKPVEHVLNGCIDAGLDCGEFQCLCKPCVKAFDVDVFPMSEPNTVEGIDGGACPKFAICGQVSQGKSIVFRAIDNKEREEPEIRVRVLRDDSTTEYLEVKKSHAENHTYYFEFDAINNRVGIEIFEVFVGEEQIPESPFRLEVTERQCAEESGEALMEADDYGNCVCSHGSHDFGGKCVPNTVLIPSIVVPLALLIAVGVYFYIEHKKRQADSVWEVDPKEIEYDEPPAILGRGTFGLVILASYRGTQVAVKRVIPPKLQDKKESTGWMTSLFGEGDAAMLLDDAEDPEPIQDVKLDFNGNVPCDLKDSQSATDPLDIESGTFSIASSKGKRRSRGKSILKDRDTSALFDFANLDDQGSKQNAESSIGMQSGGINDVLGQLQLGKQSKPVRGVWRQHSHGSLGARPTVARSSSFKQIKPRRGVTRSQSDPCLMDASELEQGAIGNFQEATPSGRSSRRSSGMLSDAEADEFNKMVEAEELSAAQSGSFSIAAFSASGSARGSLLMSGGKEKRASTLQSIRDTIYGFGGDEYTRLKQDFVEEMRYLSKLRHPCITTVMGAVVSKKSEPMLIMEYMDHGSLYDLLHNESMIIDGELVLPILRDIAQGVRFLHAANPQVIHGDLKAQNVLVDSKFRAKVADFGLSQKKKVGATGTPLWMAPELLRGESENTSKSDVYSFGIILYEVYSRKDPYEGENHLQVLRQVCDPQVNKRPPVPDTCPSTVAGIMTDCLVADPAQRPSFEELDLRLKRLDVANAEPGQQVFSMQRKKNEKAARNEQLLNDVFPPHVAEALRDGRKVDAESFECATCFFSDIVSYTTISSMLHPEKVSDMLDRLYLKFDDLSEVHNVFKIDTIGDAYMCVTNLHKDQPDHAERMARFSMDAVSAANETLIDLDDPSKGYVQIRVGFHSGPIVANVVGSRCPKYTLFGDTVNTASRMESNSLAGLIQCSDRTAELIMAQGPNVPIASRGKINVKGKGEMTTFWIGKTPKESPVAAVSKATSMTAPSTRKETSKTAKPKQSPKPASKKAKLPEQTVPQTMYTIEC